MAKPATQRPKLPSVGRLGLVEPPAPCGPGPTRLEHRRTTSNCCGRCRGPPMPMARCATMVRLAEALGGAGTSSNRAIVKDRALRGRLFGVLGSSLALGDHLVANRNRGICWPVTCDCRRWTNCGRLREAAAESATDTMRCRSLRTLYRDRLLVLAGLDLASIVENEPVLPFTDSRRASVRSRRRRVGRRADRRDADGVRRGRRGAEACDHRDGQVWRPRAELRQRRRRHLRRRDRPTRWPHGWPAR